jgi:inner membrane protein
VDPVTHVAAGLICSQLVRAPSRWWAAAAGALFAVLPDVDYVVIFWDRLAFIRYHRGFTHSLAALPLLALAGGLLGRVLGGPRWFKPMFILGLAVLASHLLLDLATSYGTQVLSPFSRQRFTLDWVFIIDPYFTALLVAGAITALWFPLRDRGLGAVCLALAAVYLLVCGLFHHQALALSHQIFQARGSEVRSVAALPQPFSCRRWHLIAAGPEQIQQTFVQLPYAAALGLTAAREPVEVVSLAPGQACPSPPLPYQHPRHLTIQTWTSAPASTQDFSPEARAILASYLEFARFPLLCRDQSQEGEQVMEWRDLRFGLPGRASAFVLELRLDGRGRLQHWLIGRRG